ncbi:nitronate monooxygenase [Streptomyces sp. NPDC056661]|uniref:nitronate monooxygenase n=1 Tax=Streptomyces sp. NPDC056661 TaxID=3345898 RepID=UPI0036B9CE80
MPPLDQVIEAADVPVIAAGGITTARSVAAVLAAGADGALVGTRFVATLEADAYPGYEQVVIRAGSANTTLTTQVSAMRPDVPHRCPSELHRRRALWRAKLRGDGTGWMPPWRHSIRRRHPMCTRALSVRTIGTRSLC